MNDIQTFLDLPFETLFVLAVGYLGYRLAYTGRASAHRSLDVLFLTAVFGLIARSAVLGFAPRVSDPVWVHALALGITVSSALFWRVWAQEACFRALRYLGISDHDGFASAWSSMLSRPVSRPTQVVVRLKSGRVLLCEQLEKFNDAPMGPCLLGEDGSIGLYVTHVLDSASSEWDERAPFDPFWGYSMTFVAADQISETEIRRQPKN